MNLDLAQQYFPFVIAGLAVLLGLAVALGVREQVRNLYSSRSGRNAAAAR